MAEALKGEESHALAEVEIFVGKQVKVQIEPLYNRGAVRRRYDVVNHLMAIPCRPDKAFTPPSGKTIL